MANARFLPICKQDMKERGWDELDIVLITGDAYVDHPAWKTAVDFLKLGMPKLFFGITAGNMDSILSNYTINRSKRKKDDYSPGGMISLRPNRATIVYANRVKELFPDTPVILGGIEASLRRLAHYDFWSDIVRRSILLDSKADLLVYGMGEKQIVEIANRIKKGGAVRELDNIRGTVKIG